MNGSCDFAFHKKRSFPDKDTVLKGACNFREQRAGMPESDVKVTKKDLPETIDKIATTFESYWNSNEFEYYNEEQKERLARALKAEKFFDSNNSGIYTMDIAPYSYQQEILDKLDAERKGRGYYHLDAAAIYKYSSFSRLCARADVIEDFSEPAEEALTKALAKCASIDSRRWINFLLGFLKDIDNTDFNSFTDAEKRMLQMFYITVWGKSIESFSDEEFLSNIYSLSDSPVMLDELIELLKYNHNNIDFIDEEVNLGFDSPLDLHCTYSRDQFLVAMDFMKPSTMREGTKYLSDKKLDVHLVTLNKSEKDYSPTTMYNDYSINETLFHWQSQSTTSEASPTGLRYANHKNQGVRELIFVREFKTDAFGNAALYTFLGTADYVRHSGSKPMNVVWKLNKAIPAKYLKKTNKLVVG